MDFYNSDAYLQLRDLIAIVEKKHKLTANHLFHLATLPQHFDVITKNLALHQIAQKHKTGFCEGQACWDRIVYEKPFGYDLKSARQINRSIARVFAEDQIFRIDHYLGKEVVANIALIRFANRVFEPLWGRDQIESVQIILSENSGVGGRGAFYDACGAVRDVVQNHMLQILALIGMEAPKHFTAQYLRDGKAKVLSKVKVGAVVLGQYNGYRKEKHVQKNSQTETFAALKVTINNSRWKGVPFYLKTGKFLKKQQASVHIKFKTAECLLDFCPADANYLTINIHPNEGFYLELNAKAPGAFDRVVPVNMNFSHTMHFGLNTPAAYEVLLADVIRGDHFAFVRADEIDYSWKIIEQMKRFKHILFPYTKGSAGPKEVEKLDSKQTVGWRV